MIAPARSKAFALALLAATMLASAATACNPPPEEIARLRDVDEDGPTKLASMIEQGTATEATQTQAALALVVLERRGRHVGLDVLAAALEKRGASSRKKLVEVVARALARGMEQPRILTADPALAFKDGAHLLLSRDLADGVARDVIAGALKKWVAESAMMRLDDQRQRYGLVPLVRLLGPESKLAVARHVEDDEYRERTVDLVLLLDEGAQHEAARILARLLPATRTVAWRDSYRPVIVESIRVNHMRMPPEDIDALVARIQAERIVQIVAGLKRLNFPESRAILLAAAEDKGLAKEDRVIALDALGAHAASLDDEQIDRVLAIVANAASIQAREQERYFAMAEERKAAHDDALVRAATRAVARAPRARAKMLEIVGGAASWRIRMATATSLLRASDAKGMDEILAKLPATAETPMALEEIRSYGEAARSIDGAPDAMRAHLTDGRLGARLAALCAHHGDVPILAPYADDTAPLPKCAGSQHCDWKCGDAEVKTVGQLVRECLKTSPYPPPLSRAEQLKRNTDELQMELLKSLDGLPPGAERGGRGDGIVK